jgi:MoaA/NifB/PqqE/SkfB family radical SAM enzyme
MMCAVMEAGFAEKIRGNKIARRLGVDESICFATESSLYFHSDGVVTGCCKNKRQIFGRYPENSLGQMWNGTGRKALGDALARDILPDGCGDCAESVRSSNHTGMLATCYDPFRSSVWRSPGPVSMGFEIGTICNFECIMCGGEKSSSIRKNRDKLPLIPSPYDDEFIRQLRPFIPTLQEARFFGGEPFLNQLNFKIWDLIAELNPKVGVSITTNGSVLSKRAKNMILALRPTIEVSLESLVPGNYEAVRVNGNLAETKANLAWLLENKALNSITVCPLRENWRDIPGIVSYCTSNQVFIYFNTVLHPHEHSLKSMSHSELDEAVRFLSSAELPASTDKVNANRYQDLVNSIAAWRDEAGSSRREEQTRPERELRPPTLYTECT